MKYQNRCASYERIHVYFICVDGLPTGSKIEEPEVVTRMQKRTRNATKCTGMRKTAESHNS